MAVTQRHGRGCRCDEVGLLRNDAAIVCAGAPRADTALNKEASYVDINCSGSLVALRSSGFQEVSTNRARQVLDAPVIVAASNGPQSGQIQVRLKGDSHRRALQGRLKPMGGEFGPVITFENTREIVFKGLVAGTTYIMQLCGLGGSTGQSDWSEPVTKVAT